MGKGYCQRPTRGIPGTISIWSGKTSRERPQQRRQGQPLFFEPSITRYLQDLNSPPRGPLSHERNTDVDGYTYSAAILSCYPTSSMVQYPHEGSLQGKHGKPQCWLARSGSRSGGTEPKKVRSLGWGYRRGRARGFSHSEQHRRIAHSSGRLKFQRSRFLTIGI